MELDTKNFAAPGERIFDVFVEGELAISNLDIFSAAGGWSTAYVASVLTTVSDGNVTIEFVSVVENPTISAIEVIQVNGNGTVVEPLVPSQSPLASPSGSSSPTFDVDGFAVAECSAYAACVDLNVTGLCCPMSNGESRECCATSLVPCK
jgi:Malectin domain